LSIVGIVSKLRRDVGLNFSRSELPAGSLSDIVRASDQVDFFPKLKAGASWLL